MLVHTVNRLHANSGGCCRTIALRTIRCVTELANVEHICRETLRDKKPRQTTVNSGFSQRIAHAKRSLHIVHYYFISQTTVCESAMRRCEGS